MSLPIPISGHTRDDVRGCGNEDDIYDAGFVEGWNAAIEEMHRLNNIAIKTMFDAWEKNGTHPPVDP